MAPKSDSDSSLSSLSATPDPSSGTSPDTLAQVTKATVKTQTKTNSKGKKRKAETVTTTTKRTKKAVVEAEEAPNHEEVAETPKKGQKRAVKKAKVTDDVVEETAQVEAEEDYGETKVVVKKTKRKSKAEKEAELAPLEERTVGSKLLVGAHVSIAGGVHNSITNLIHIGANAFAVFLKNQRKWDNPALDPEHATLFIDGCKKHDVEPGICCLPHGSYLVNLAHPAEDRKKQAYDSFLDDLTRSHKLGIKLYNFHPGNSNATTREDGIRLIAENINKAHKDPATGEVIPVLETMASLGNTIGGTFEDLAEIIKLVEDKNRIGVCIDTCHIFAAGYDLRTPEAFAETMKKFDEVIGLKYLKALHINDSKAPFASHRDLHARIGTGYLGLRPFHNLVNDKRLHGLPMVLETPIDVKGEDGKKIEDKGIWAREIKLLERLVGMYVEGDEFKKLEKELFEAGADERERIGGQVERKKAKAAGEKGGKKGGKGKKKAESKDADEDDE
ncbi:AP endonuclease [Zopfia rhizophila CBS 207.26]|uniref:Apurinic-apyrimidinic endonuclease 1 n=1 Tax=Zopfia rhizophila CBS 207.26 TaxID=1314779 RepID=A0A6A6EWK2_9PEZI|nr:AP endonuclease [Zopfia rhizophila CBS 207.26]